MGKKNAEQLQEHMLWTYYGLRVGLSVIGFSLPLVVLFTGGVLHHVWLEPSLSQYYLTEDRVSFFTTRDLFVGGLFAASACLYLYKGFSDKENVALNLAAVFVVLVALLPTVDPAADQTLVSVLHGTSAVLFFVCIAYVSLFRSRDTLRLVPSAKRRGYIRRYRWTGATMIASPLVAVVLSFALEPVSQVRTVIFWVETLGVWTFALYWTVKTTEMRESSAEKRALDAELSREVVPAVPLDEADRAAVDQMPHGTRARPAAPLATVERVVPAARRTGASDW